MKSIKVSIIIVTGTPGTGKTTFAKRLAKSKGYKYIDVNKIVKKYGLSEGYDQKRKTKIIDEKKLAKVLEKIIKDARKKKEKLVIDSHLSHYIAPRYVDLCIVTKCSLKELEKRLKKKGYSKAKINENIECEIMDICLNEAMEFGYKVRVVKSGKKIKNK